ncbi:MAG: holin family protein [Paracoccaceae bacterium]
MGLIDGMFTLLFGNGRNVVRDTAEVFRENAEGAAARAAGLHEAVLEQFAAEFARPRRGLFDRMIDGLNRLPRPALALGTVGLFAAAMTDPIWFAARMQGIALVPEPLWWLLGAIISFYFGARHQAKGQEFQRSIAETMTRASEVTGNLHALRALEAGAGAPPAPEQAERNAALEDWRAGA